MGKLFQFFNVDKHFFSKNMKKIVLCHTWVYIQKSLIKVRKFAYVYQYTEKVKNIINMVL